MGRLKIKKVDEKSVEIELEGEDHSMANLIAKYALRNPHTKFAAYNVPHPLIANPIIQIVTDGTIHPLDLLEQVLKEILADIEKFKESVEKAFNEVSEKGS
ncbi:MAG TPA: DNA-directed RNA polymerase subunit L [Pyrodictium sp.]|nr:DNA-directed RNA polymerase subunit L [Pyrodictium sp.]